jgi:putative PEP-CTERM system histidine kinase
MTFPPPAIVVLHLACVAAYAVLAALLLFRQRQARTGRLLAGASLVTAAWALSVAIDWEEPTTGLPAWLELARSAAWYGFLLHLYHRWVSPERQLRQTLTTIGLLALMVVGALPLSGALPSPELLPDQLAALLASVSIVVRLGFAVCTILLIENLYFNTPREARWHLNLLCIALGGLCLYDLVLYADAALFRRVSMPLFAGRASAMIVAAPLLALAAARNRRWSIDIHVSREVVFHSATLVASGLFLLGLAVAGEVFRRGGAEWGNVAELTLIFAGLLMVAVLLSSGSARSRLRAVFVDNFFTHRYDYRREWMACIETLTAPQAHTGLHTRAIRAVAQAVDSPAGALFVRAPEEVAFQWAGSWNMPAVTAPTPPGHPLLPLFRDGDWIVELDGPEVADGGANGGASGWFPELERLWLAVPLNHHGALIGFVVLARSRGGSQFKLDREVFDLLRIIGREVASRVAEQRAAQVLSQTLQLREYSQRFAFVIHDIKNVSGQLSMLLTNAEVHADNPAFQRDMIGTVRASVGKITRLLTRLQVERQEREHALIVPLARLRPLVAFCRAPRGVTVEISAGGGNAGVAIDPDSFDTVVTHLLNNAIEASPESGQVRIELREEALSVVIDIVDRGPGMTPEFVRDRLFRPFATTKDGGHGIGAYQARELLREAGGDLLVLSRPGEGTTMRLLLPSVGTAVADSAARSA